jgi:hypothetical protein
MATTTESYTKSEIVEIIMGIHHRISELKIDMAFRQPARGDRAVDSRLEAIEDAENALRLFLRDLAEMEVGA